MGKDEPITTADDSPMSNQKISGEIPSMKLGKESEKKPEPERKIIKFDKPEKTPDEKKTDPVKVDAVPNVNKIVGDKTPGASTDSAREELEQRRTILQNMKDFDFQIKKNQEDISNLTNKIENISKDLDDLVSLYEIVSEQMNPFVGLSKVTKKRLDALENITNEIETVKTRVGDLELFVEKSGSIETLQKKRPPVPTPETIMASSANPTTLTPMQTPYSIDHNVSEKELDDILAKSFEVLRTEQTIDFMIDEFFLSLK